jgi:hypothetical protein
VFKTLFTKEELKFDDFCETKNVVQGTMYLDFTESDDISKMTHVGRTGSFVPVLEGGGNLLRVKDGKTYAVTGTKGYKWVIRDVALEREAEKSLDIDMTYFNHLQDQALEAINKQGSFEELTEG